MNSIPPSGTNKRGIGRAWLLSSARTCGPDDADVECDARPNCDADRDADVDAARGSQHVQALGCHSARRDAAGGLRGHTRRCRCCCRPTGSAAVRDARERQPKLRLPRLYAQLRLGPARSTPTGRHGSRVLQRACSGRWRVRHSCTAPSLFAPSWNGMRFFLNVKVTKERLRIMLQTFL